MTSFTPDPTDMRGFVDTSGTAGVADNRIEVASPVFDQAREESTLRAAEALEGGDASGVVNLDPENEKASEALRDAAADVKEDPFDPTAPNEFAAAAGEEGSQDDEDGTTKEAVEEDAKKEVEEDASKKENTTTPSTTPASTKKDSLKADSNGASNKSTTSTTSGSDSSKTSNSSTSNK